LPAGEKVALVGFGSFEVRQRGSQIRARSEDGSYDPYRPLEKPLVFKAGKSLKDAVK